MAIQQLLQEPDPDDALVASIGKLILYCYKCRAALTLLVSYNPAAEIYTSDRARFNKLGGDIYIDERRLMQEEYN